MKAEGGGSKTLIILLPSNYPFLEPQFMIIDEASEQSINEQIASKERQIGE